MQFGFKDALTMPELVMTSLDAAKADEKLPFMYNTVILEEDLKYYPGRLSLARHFLGPKLRTKFFPARDRNVVQQYMYCRSRVWKTQGALCGLPAANILFSQGLMICRRLFQTDSRLLLLQGKELAITPRLRLEETRLAVSLTPSSAS